MQSTDERAMLHLLPNACAQELDLSLRRAEVGGRSGDVCDAFRSAGSFYRRQGDLDSAVTMFEQTLRCSTVTAGVDLTVDVLCELGETLADQADVLGPQGGGDMGARRDMACDRAYEAVQLASRSADPCWEVTVLLRMSDLLDRLGDHDGATLLQIRALSRGVPAVDFFDLDVDLSRALRH